MSLSIPSLPPEKYRGQRIGLMSRVPYWAKRVLLVGTDMGRPGHLLRKREGVEVHGIEADPHDAALAGELLDSVIEGRPDTVPMSFAEESFDAILILDPPDLAALEAWLPLMTPFLSQYGRILVLFINAGYWRDAPGPALLFGEAASAARGAGYDVFGETNALDPEYTAPGEDEARAGCIEFLLTLTRPDYDPVAHSQCLREAGRPDQAFAALREIPNSAYADEDAAIEIQSSMLEYLLEWGRRATLDTPDRLYYQAIELFYKIVKEQPLHTAAYQSIAGIWELMGAPEMSARQLRSRQHAEPEAGVAARLKKLPTGRLLRSERVPPDWTQSDAPPSILFIMPPRPHFGLDVLYDGLTTVLGPENVVDFPPKPALHGGIDPDFASYPCNFDLPSRDYTLERCLDELRAGKFDFVLYGDCERALTRRMARAITAAAEKTPIFIVDQRDEFFNCEQETLDYIGLDEARGYFKREMLACLDYGPRAMPLPFAFPDCRVPKDVDAPREHFFFWAGHRRFSLRRLYLEQIEAQLGENFDARFTPEEYAARLGASKVGLNCFGMGFDTVRYWELPAHGCLLLSERLPIVIPHDFRDGETALFFDDASELERKLNYARRYPELVENLAAAGREHFLAHHTGSARAKHLLGWIDASLKG